MTHVEKLFSLIEEGEKLRDKMRNEMLVMKDIIERQNKTALSQGALLNQAERAKNVYQKRVAARDKRANERDRELGNLRKKVKDMQAFNTKAKEYLKSRNGGFLPEELWERNIAK